MPETLWSKNLPLDARLHGFTVGDDYLIDRQLLPFDIIGSAAHARMLGECGLLPVAEAKSLVGALRQMQTEPPLSITTEQEDCHTAIEHALTQRLGATGRRIHLARSRNDQVQTALRLFMRARLVNISEDVQRCASAFIDFAERHDDIPLPGYTHMRRAMPSSWATWGEAFAEGLLEELEAAEALWTRLDRSPLGAAAGFGTAAEINRQRSAELLGFSRVQRSPIDVMNSRGRHELAFANWICSVTNTLEKAIWDLLVFSTQEFGFVRLPDAFTTGSSLMPQKRNPDVLELSRGRCRELRGLTSLLAQLSGGLPSSYHRDQQLLKAPFFEIVAKGAELLDVIAHLLPGIEVNADACRTASTAELHAANEACRLAAQGMPFRDAYRTVAQQLADGTFHPETTSTPAADLTSARAELTRSAASFAEKRQSLDDVIARLFDWT